MGVYTYQKIHLAKLGFKQKLHWFKHVMVTQVTICTECVYLPENSPCQIRFQSQYCRKPVLLGVYI